MQLHTITDKIKNNGYKSTSKRSAIIDILNRNKRFMTAKELYKDMLKIYPSISIDTVYRNLTMFMEMDVLEMTELEGERRYRLLCNHHDEHHHHIICTHCGKTDIIASDCPLDNIEIPGNFQITGHRFEIFGVCNTCVHY
jgi:Fur family zinc uptake transcriptional regulator